MIYECPQPTPMLLSLNVHYTRSFDFGFSDRMVSDPPVACNAFWTPSVTGAIA